jgi:hypothetical protein
MVLPSSKRNLRQVPPKCGPCKFLPEQPERFGVIDVLGPEGRETEGGANNAGGKGS